jgi:uncharacterized protein HemY
MQDRYATAEFLLRRVGALTESIPDAPSGVRFSLTGQIGMLHLAQQDYPGAESLLRQALAGFKTAGDSVSAIEVKYLEDSLAVLYDRTGRPTSADSMRTEAGRLHLASPSDQ